jgi:hypothetical protein
MDKVRKPSNSVCYTPSSEPYRIYLGLNILLSHIILFNVLPCPDEMETDALMLAVVGNSF